MHTKAEKGQENRTRVAHRPSQRTSGSKATFQLVDNRPATVQLRKLQDTMDASPRLAGRLTQLEPVQRQLDDGELMQGKFEPVQRVEEEELMQGKFEPVQRVEEEELMQGKFEPVQRVEEEELMQGKFEPVQRVEEEELMQGKFEPVQRVEEEELMQGKFEPVQRVEEEELMQGKFEPVQRVEEEELMQGKFEPVQRVEEEELMQGKFAAEAPAQLKVKNRTGMPDTLKSGLENLSGFDMSGVRVHYNSDKPAQLNALAYAQGTDIHLGPGQDQHLPHEAWHTVQQMQGRVQPTMQAHGASINDDTSLEQEADVMGANALAHGTQLKRMPEE